MLTDGCSVSYFRLRTKLRFAVPTTDSVQSSKPAFCRDKNRLIQASYTFAVIKLDSPNIYIPPTGFAVLKTDCPTSKSILHALQWSKPTIPATTSLLHALQCSKRTIPTSYTLCGALHGLSKAYCTLEMDVLRSYTVKINGS